MGRLSMIYDGQAAEDLTQDNDSGFGQCWHESCDRKAVYELDTCDGETIHVCEMCDMMWSNCDHCGKSDVVGEGINICGDSFLCDRCLDERQNIIVTKAAETYIKEVEPDGPENGRIEDYTVHHALTQAMYDLEWTGLPYRHNSSYDSDENESEYNELADLVRDRLGVD